jgi:hypothetical protein
MSTTIRRPDAMERTPAGAKRRLTAAELGGLDPYR